MTMETPENNDSIEVAGSSPVPCSALEILANELEMPADDIREAALEMRHQKAGFRPGDMVTISEGSEYRYEVAAVERFPHGLMVGIYDEPPSKHVDYWNPGSLHHVSNVPSDLSLLAFGTVPAREADQQELCRKSRRDRD